MDLPKKDENQNQFLCLFLQAFPSKHTTLSQGCNNVVDVQTTLYQRQNDVVCLLGSNSICIRAELKCYVFFSSCLALRTVGISISNRLCQGVLQKSVYTVHYLTISIGFLISFVMISLDWLPVVNTDSQHNMVVFFLTMAGACAVSLILFSVVIWKLEFDKRPTVRVSSSKILLKQDLRNVSIL